MARSIRRRMQICELDLTGSVVVTEAATGPYASTAAAAAASGAEVWAFAAESPYGTVADAAADVMMLLDALAAGSDRLTIVTRRQDLPLERTTLITNSGVLRPIDGSMIERLPAEAVIALMYEDWEARSVDIDYAAASARGIVVMAVDEHHPACGAFDFVGDLVVAAVLRRRWPVRGARFAVVSDNAFGEPIVDALKALGAEPHRVDGPAAPADVEQSDVVVIATTPATSAANGSAMASPQAIARYVIDSGAFACVSLWGDVDTELLRGAGVMVEPEDETEPGHQGITMSEAGFEAVVRLQVGGLAAALHGDGGEGPLRGLGRELLWGEA